MRRIKSIEEEGHPMTRGSKAGPGVSGAGRAERLVLLAVLVTALAGALAGSPPPDPGEAFGLAHLLRGS